MVDFIQENGILIDNMFAKLGQQIEMKTILKGVGQKLDIWIGLQRQIYLGNERFVSTMQQNRKDWK